MYKGASSREIIVGLEQRVSIWGSRLGCTRHHRVRHSLEVGQRVWIWNTKTVTIRDKLEQWWEGLGELIGKIGGSVWQIRAPNGKVWIRHSDMLRPYRG